MAFVVHILADYVHWWPSWKMADTVDKVQIRSLKWLLWCLVWVCQVSRFYHKLQDFSVICWTRSLRCSWSIFDLKPGFNRWGKDNCKIRQKKFKCWDLVRRILEVWRYLVSLMTWYKHFHGGPLYELDTKFVLHCMILWNISHRYVCVQVAVGRLNLSTIGLRVHTRNTERKVEK